MKIAVPIDGINVSQHFGHCSGFLMADVEEGKVVMTKVLENPGHRPGFLPGFLKEQGVQCVIAGGLGARAYQLFNDEGIKVITGASGNAIEIINLYLADKLESTGSLCSEHMHAGECGEHK